MKTKVISFDLDGTITNSKFPNYIWLEEIPRLYAIKHNMPINQAKQAVIEDYNKVGNENLQWYNIKYWFKKYNLNKNPINILNLNKTKIELFDEVIFTLNNLTKQKKKLIIISNARREFLDLEIQQTKIKKFFKHIFSATSDFNLIKNKPTVFLEVCKICHILPSEMIHIGDDYKFDYRVPKNAGIKAIFLNREKQTNNKEEISNLTNIIIE